MNSEEPLISVIIPTLNEERLIQGLLDQISNTNFNLEIIIVDGGSIDKTIQLCEKYQLKIFYCEKGRGRQLAKGVCEARGDYFLFLHADVSFQDDSLQFIERLLVDKTPLASFIIHFDLDHWFLRLNEFFSRFAIPSFYFGDQGLWISREVYMASGGFDPKDRIMEDQLFYRKANRIISGKKVPAKLFVSARKYREKGVFRLQFFYYKLWLMLKLGASQDDMEKKYLNFFT